MTIRYTTSLDGITLAMLPGFFVGWKKPYTAEDHLRILQGSDYVVLAIEDDAGRVVGFVTAIADGLQAAFIPLLEVLPEYQHRGIGTELVHRMLDLVKNYPCVDLTCDLELQPFYERLGMLRSVGMVIRNY